MKLLVVDDSATMRRIVVNSLSRIGFTDGVEAGDGGNALDGKTVPVLMVSTRSVRQDIVQAAQAAQAAQAGVSNYVVKPFTPQALKEKIEQVLGAEVA